MASILLVCTDQEKFFDFMERLHITVTDFAKMTAPSFKNLPGRLSTPAALEISIFLNSLIVITRQPHGLIKFRVWTNQNS